MPVEIDEDGRIPANDPRRRKPFTQKVGEWETDGTRWWYRDMSGHRWTGTELFWLNMFLGAVLTAAVAAGLYYM